MNRPTRRHFLEQSMLATAATMALQSQYAAQSRADDDKSPKVGPNDTILVAVVGAGGRGQSHIGGFAGQPGTEVTHICDCDERAGESSCDVAAEKQNGRRPVWVKDVRRLLEDNSIDAVSIATPNHWHALGAIWAVQAGKDVYVEKPVSHNVLEGRRLVQVARKHNRIVQTGTQSRSNPGMREAMAFIHSGGIGDVKVARGLCYKRRASIGPKGNYELPAGVDYDLWSGPAPVLPLTRKRFHYDWHWQRMYGNGDLGNQGPHQTDVARWGLGIDTHPNSIITYGGRLGYQAERKDPNYVDAGDTGNTEISIYDYGNKSIVFETRGLDVGDSDDEELNKLFQSTKGNKVGVVFYGSDGYLVQASYNHSIAYDKDMNVIKEFKGGDNHFTNFLDACVSRKVEDLNADVREGHLSAAISHLGNISYYMGESNKVAVDELSHILSGVKSLDDNQATLDRTVKHLQKNGVDLARYSMSAGPLLQFDSATELFTNNDAANAYLTREYREPYVCPTADKV